MYTTPRATKPRRAQRSAHGLSEARRAERWTWSIVVAADIAMPRTRGSPRGTRGGRAQPSATARRSRAPRVRVPHQRRSRPSTNRTSSAAALELGPVPLGERVRLARRHHQVGAAGSRGVGIHLWVGAVGGGHVGHAERPQHRAPVGRLAERHPRAASRSAPTLGGVGAGSGRGPIGSHVAPTAAASAPIWASSPARSRTASTWTATPARHERVVVLAAVLLLVEHHEVGRQLDDVGDGGVLGAADVGEVGLLAEPCARDRTDAPREEGLRHRRHQAHDTRGDHRALRVERLDLLGVLGVDAAALELRGRRELLGVGQPLRRRGSSPSSPARRC